MQRFAIGILVLSVSSVLYWQSVCQIGGTAEPWDTDRYWQLWYPASLALSAMAGLFVGSRGWTAGAILTFAQLPVMWLNAGSGSLWAVGVVMTCILAIPAVAISALAGWLAARQRPA